MLSNELKNEGYEVDVFISRLWPKRQRHRFLKIASTGFQWMLTKFGVKTYYGQVTFDLVVGAYIQLTRPDLLIVGEICSLYSIKVAKKLNIHVHYDLAGVGIWENLRLYRNVDLYKNNYQSITHFRNELSRKRKEMLSADSVSVLSQYVYATFPSWAKEKTFVTGLPIESDLTKSVMVKSYRGTYRILFVGRYSDLKGCKIVQGVIEYLLGLGRDVTLDVAGSRDGFTWNTAQLPIFDHGFANREVLNRLYERADLFLCPSYTDSWNRSVVDAFIRGIPALVSPVVGCIDLLPQEKRKLLICKSLDQDKWNTAASNLLKHGRIEYDLIGIKSKENYIKSYLHEIQNISSSS